MNEIELLKRIAQEAAVLINRFEELGMDGVGLGYSFELQSLTEELEALRKHSESTQS